jgi:large subunit ribosomal protein L2
MPVKRLKPTTPGQRFRIANTNSEVGTHKKPEKSLLVPNKKSGGRNNQGRMTIKGLGGGHKRKYRIIDFIRERHGDVATVTSVQYDPNRSARIALVEYADKELRYIICPTGLKEGATVVSGPGSAPEIGNALPLGEIPLGTIIHNIELAPRQGARMCRSAGNYAQILAREGKYATIKLPSGETRMVLTTCMAVIGSVSNSEHMLENMGKAGRNRWKGRRPSTRPSAMNPVDHPMGGGEGRNKGGQPRNKNLVYSQGQKTRDKNKASSALIVDKRVSKRNK